MARSSFPIAAMAARRSAVALFDAAAAVSCALIASLAFAQSAWAYVDPSVMTYTIQALAGVAVALSAVAGVAFRRTRKKLLALLNVDENAGKDVDYAFARIERSAANRTLGADRFGGGSPSSVGDAPDKAARSPHREREREGLGRRMALSVAVALFVAVTLGVLAPFETLMGGSGSLVFGLGEIWQPIVVAALGIAAVLALALSALRGRAFNVCLLLAFSFGLACYLQAMFLNGGLPTTDGRVSTWTNYKTITVVSAAVWLVVFALPLQLSKLNRKLVQTAAGALAAVLVVVQGVAAGSLVVDALSEAPTEEGEVPANQYIMTRDDLYTLSPGKNVVFFVLDTYDTADMMRNLSLDPTFSQRLAGFTWFPDAVGAMSPTRYGVPFLLTGEYPHADEPFATYVGQRYLRSSYLSDIYDAGYSIGLYSDTLGDSMMSDADRRDLIYKKTVNIVKPAEGEAPSLDVGATLKMLVQCACYRDLLWLAKPFCYYTTDALNEVMVDAGDGEGGAPTQEPYVMQDAYWYDKLQELGLTFEDRESAGAFRFIHLLGTHMPYTIDEFGDPAPDGYSSLEEQALGSLRMVLDYVDRMKELGVFEDATIVITADHGIWGELPVGPLPYASSAIMMVKPAGVGADAGELTMSDAKVTAYDALPTVMEAIYGDSHGYGPTLFDRTAEERERLYVMDYCVDNVDLLEREFDVEGVATDLDSWVATGVEWDPTGTPR